METKLNIMLQLVRITAYLQKRGIHHQDIKSKNILVKIPEKQADVKVRLCDFGAAVFANRNFDIFKVPGTREYLAPELFEMINYEEEEEQGEEEKKEEVKNK